MVPDNARKILRNALLDAGKVLLSHFGSSHKATVKESISSVVTKADMASESFDRNYTIVAAGAEIHESIMNVLKNN